MKILLLIPGAIFYTQCNNKGTGETGFEQDSMKFDNYIMPTNRTDDSYEELASLFKPKLNEPYNVLEGSKKLSFPQSTVTWVKNAAISIKDLDNKPIEALKDKLRYSYSISPIKKDDKFNAYTMPIVLFETVKDLGSHLEVISFNLPRKPKLDFNTRAYYLFLGIKYTPDKTEKSGEDGYDTANPFWIPGQNKEVIPALTHFSHIEAQIQVKNHKNQTITTYNILLDSSYLIKLIKDTLLRYPEIKETATDFKLY